MVRQPDALVEVRLSRLYSERIRPARYRERHLLPASAWDVPDEPVPFAEACQQNYSAQDVGVPWGRPWGTTWFRVNGEVPATWAASARVDLVVDLGFSDAAPGFQAEGLVWTPDGTILKGLHPRSRDVPLDARPGERVDVFIEAASNPDVGGGWTYAPTPLGDPVTAGIEPLYRFGGAWAGLVDEEVFALERDWWTLTDLMRSLPTGSTRRAQLLRAMEAAADSIDPDDVAGTAKRARGRLAPVLSASPGSAVHRIAAVGHAHIDSAWLWPVRETIRKCARTFANALDLMERDPDFVFAASSAQQYAWIKERYPELFARIRARVQEGRWVPVGGMWVEPDTNMPGGESLVRQFVVGKQFFLAEFGIDSDDVWLPDSFGYSAALPQIAAGVGARTFLTQKTSKNETNRIPHSTFLWEGIDGTRLLAHLPPVDTYHSDLSAADLARSEDQNAERGLFDVTLVPFGFGDGGGGPNVEMIEVARRKNSLDGSPRVEFRRPSEFFAEANAIAGELEVWSGELYLELHRGTYTSQARTKLGNRRSEHLLREAELWAATAAVRVGAEYPADTLRRAWETVLLGQFHDILCGAGITWVHREAERWYEQVEASLEATIRGSIVALGGAGESPRTMIAYNASPFVVDGVPPLGAAEPTRSGGGTSVVAGSDAVLTSPWLVARFDMGGGLVSLIDRSSGRELVPEGAEGNALEMLRDTPAQFDAWDIDVDYRRTPPVLSGRASVGVEDGKLLVERTIGSSTVRQRISLAADRPALEFETRVDWHERQKMLKLGFPLAIHTEQALSEIQFGHIRRPVHENTTWDAARFEVSGHRWTHVAETASGVTIANDRTYGRDIRLNRGASGGRHVTVRETLLRSATFPDPRADEGEHVFRHSIVVGSLLDGIAEGYRVNLPQRRSQGVAAQPLVTVAGAEGVLIEAVKLADDGSGDVIVRLYEALGRAAEAWLQPGFTCTRASRCDLLERSLPDQPAEPLQLSLRAFELTTIRLGRD